MEIDTDMQLWKHSALDLILLHLPVLMSTSRDLVGLLSFAPPQDANHGGYIDFHYNGSTTDYTSRLIEGSELQLMSTDKNVVVKTAGSGKTVILNAPANNSILQNAPTAADDAKTSKAIATVGWVASKFLP